MDCARFCGTASGHGRSTRPRRFRRPALDWNLECASESLNRGRAARVLESIFYNKQLVNHEFVSQVFTNHVHNNDGYTIHSVMAGLGSAQYEDGNLKSIHAPTLIVWGRQDELIPESVAEKMHDGIAGSKLVVLDQCGHVPEIEKAADFNQAVLEFLGK
jgi:2-hydroxy-6-oxonona-2,4-dienedioate hydrolase